MLTVKFIEPNGHEMIVETKRVWTEPDEGKAITQPRVYADRGNDLHPFCFETYGDVYVMNENGKTIAHYFLGREAAAPAAPAAQPQAVAVA